ncbi:MAG: hypothetical protein WAM14_11310 [Candidatus Nitrosopolaris sp.]
MVIEVWMIKDNKTYSIIFSALPDQLHNYISTLQKMIDSFKLQYQFHSATKSGEQERRNGGSFGHEAYSSKLLIKQQAFALGQ